MSLHLKVNQQSVQVDATSDTPLLWVLREHLGLKGPKFGCGVGSCGACTVIINGVATRSCITPASGVVGADIYTIEGLSERGDHPLQKAWNDIDVPQCGYCQAGQIMSAAALLQHTPHPSDEQINDAMKGNLCRCGTYARIREAIHKAAAESNPTHSG